MDYLSTDKEKLAQIETYRDENWVSPAYCPKAAGIGSSPPATPREHKWI